MRLRLLFACVALAPAASAQDLWLVDSTGQGDFTVLQDAVDAAADGDALWVYGGQYSGAVIAGKGLAIVARPGNQVLVDGGFAVRDTQSGQDVVLAGLVASGRYAAGLVPEGLEVTSAQGAVRVEDCVLSGAQGLPYSGPSDRGVEAARVQDGADVAFVRCLLFAGHGNQSFGGFQFNRGGDGLLLDGGDVTFADGVLDAGDGGDHDILGDGLEGNPGHGLHVIEGRVTIQNSRAAGGQAGELGLACGVGGHGIFLENGGAGTHAQILDCELIGGPPGCNLGSDGMPLMQEPGTSAISLAGLARSHSSPRAAAENGPMNFVFEGQPGDDAYVLISPGPAQVQLPALNGALLLSTPLAGERRFIGVVPASGQLAVTLIAPPLPAGVEARPLYLQSAFVDPGDTVWLASPATPLVLIP